MNFTFQPQNFISNLSYMAKGMVGIFVVILLIVGVTSLLGRVSNRSDDQS